MRVHGEARRVTRFEAVALAVLFEEPAPKAEQQVMAL